MVELEKEEKKQIVEETIKPALEQPVTGVKLQKDMTETKVLQDNNIETFNGEIIDANGHPVVQQNTSIAEQVDTITNKVNTTGNSIGEGIVNANDKLNDGFSKFIDRLDAGADELNNKIQSNGILSNISSKLDKFTGLLNETADKVTGSNGVDNKERINGLGGLGAVNSLPEVHGDRLSENNNI